MITSIRKILISDTTSRIDRALADAAPDLSRARIQALLEDGAITSRGKVVTGASRKAMPGVYEIAIPPILPATPTGQDMSLVVLFEDSDLIVLDKPAGMSAHPAPGNPDSTLVNALIHHCGRSLSGIGGVARPGIVHRLDKNTSGVMVAAKTDVAHIGLSALFAAHDIDRVYVALTRGAVRGRRGSIIGRIGRSPSDRKKMAILKEGGREATTHYVVLESYGPERMPLASRIECRLETGRTHQIRVHLASEGAPCLGDPTYGSGVAAASVRTAIAEAGLSRQALHAAVLGFKHPVSGEHLRFETSPPPDMLVLQDRLRSL